MTAHGTLQGYNWHRSRKVPACDECRAFWSEYMSTRKTPKKPTAYHKVTATNKDQAEMDALLEANPPVIQWEKRNGVMYAVQVDDPHAETKATAKAERLRAQEQADRETALALMQQEADEVAERLRKFRADNSPLMAAARTEL